MRRLLVFCLVGLILATAGCGSDREKGINKDIDKPKKAEEKK